MKRLVIAAIALAAAAATLSAATPAPVHYALVQTVPLGPPDGWDFVHFDPAQARVYVAHSSEVTVVDGRSGKLVGRIAGIDGAHDVATVPALGRGYADNGKSGDVTVFDLRTLKTIGRILADKDSDAMIYDPATKRLVVANGDAHDASVIDPVAGKRIANVPLGGSPEMMALDGHGGVFINIASANQIVHLDLRSNTIEGHMDTPGCEGPHGLALDSSNQRLFASCRNAQMIVVDARNGAKLALVPIGLGTDSAAFDPKRKRAFSANKDGTLSVVAEQGPAKFVALGNEPTALGARNMAIDPATGRVFLATATVTGQHPPKKAGAAPDLDFAPGSVKLLILDPR